MRHSTRVLAEKLSTKHRLETVCRSERSVPVKRSWASASSVYYRKAKAFIKNQTKCSVSFNRSTKQDTNTGKRAEVGKQGLVIVERERRIPKRLVHGHHYSTD